MGRNQKIQKEIIMSLNITKNTAVTITEVHFRSVENQKLHHKDFYYYAGLPFDVKMM